MWLAIVSGVSAVYRLDPAPGAGREPYRTLVPELVDRWIGWAAGQISGTPAKRRREAAAAIAIIDGLLLLRHLAGPDTADLAARSIGAPQVRSD